MRQAAILAGQEVRGNRGRVLVKAAILLGAIGTQLFTSLAAEASEQAVTTYGAAVFGYEQTFRADFEAPPSLAQLATMDATLDDELRAHPAAVVVLQAGVPAGLTSAKAPTTGPETSATLTSFHGPWTQISATTARSRAFSEVDGGRAMPRLVVSGPLADRLGVSPTTLVTVTAADAATAPLVDGWAHSPVVLPDVPAHRGSAEQDKALVNDVLASRSLVQLLGAAPDSASLYWRCTAAECPDVAGIAEAIARTAGLRLAAGYRVDSHDTLTPVLRQQREQGDLFAWVALGLGAIAVAVVATALVEVRTPELVTLRTLGATRSTLFGAALLEGLVVAVAVGVLAMAASVAMARLDPDLLNHIDAVKLERFHPPLGVYLRTGTVTVLVGLVTGLLPALRAYRLVRAN